MGVINVDMPRWHSVVSDRSLDAVVGRRVGWWTGGVDVGLWGVRSEGMAGREGGRKEVSATETRSPGGGVTPSALSVSAGLVTNPSLLTY